MPSVAPADRDPNLLRALVERFSSLPRAINNKGPRGAFDVYGGEAGIRTLEHP